MPSIRAEVVTKRTHNRPLEGGAIINHKHNEVQMNKPACYTPMFGKLSTSPYKGGGECYHSTCRHHMVTEPVCDAGNVQRATLQVQREDATYTESDDIQNLLNPALLGAVVLS
jgi:hypothetical protein